MTRMAYVPGSVRFTYRAQELRTPRYRTWRGKAEMGWCWECLLCGEWGSSSPGRGHAVTEVSGARRHPSWCHVATGCACPQPHLTAMQAARLGIGGEYPYNLGGVLLRLAGGTRKPCPPCFDKNGTPHCETARQIVAKGQS